MRLSRLHISETKAPAGPQINPTPTVSAKSHPQCFNPRGSARELRCNALAQAMAAADPNIGRIEKKVCLPIAMFFIGALE